MPGFMRLSALGMRYAQPVSMPQKLLLVDDDPNNLKNLAYFLRTQGYNVYAASNGSEAAQLLQANEFDLVLSDVIMPGVNGLELLERVRSLVPELPVLLMSGAPLDQNEILERGAADFIMKPLELDDLLARVTRVLNHH
jgi:DNA-binding response OmpR family regulator